jgi:hypothetical protein
MGRPKRACTTKNAQEEAPEVKPAKKAKAGLAVGDDLPAFELEDDEGAMIKSSDMVSITTLRWRSVARAAPRSGVRAVHWRWAGRGAPPSRGRRAQRRRLAQAVHSSSTYARAAHWPPLAAREPAQGALPVRVEAHSRQQQPAAAAVRQQARRAPCVPYSRVVVSTHPTWATHTLTPLLLR